MIVFLWFALSILSASTLYNLKPQEKNNVVSRFKRLNMHLAQLCVLSGRLACCRLILCSKIIFTTSRVHVRGKTGTDKIAVKCFFQKQGVSSRAEQSHLQQLPSVVFVPVESLI